MSFESFRYFWQTPCAVIDVKMSSPVASKVAMLMTSWVRMNDVTTSKMRMRERQIDAEMKPVQKSKTFHWHALWECPSKHTFVNSYRISSWCISTENMD